LVTAHGRRGEPLALNWKALANSTTTLGVYMGRGAAVDVAHALMDAGMRTDTPVLVAVNISLPTERLIRGRLSALPFLVKAISNDDPTLMLIGEAVETRPGDLMDRKTIHDAEPAV
jgi:uroporphyrin-III C-methyltransferase